MLISKKLLEELIPFISNINDETLIKNFNQLGIEVEKTKYFEVTKKLKFGRIINVSEHHNANNVRVCSIEINKKISHIVCGAKNLIVGKNVIVAQDGVKMIDGRLIESKDFRGVISEGMLCGYSELTKNIDYLSDLDDDEIILLSNDEINLIKNPLDAIGFNDTVFDISTPSNRNDLNGLLCIANEFNSLYNKKIFEFKNDYNFPSKHLKVKSSIKQDFFAIKICNFSYSHSNWKTKSILMASGIKPQNTVIDVSSISSLISGVPILGINSEKITNIVIQKLEEDQEVETTIFGLLKLKIGDLVYVANDEIIAVVGIDTLKKYQITNQTKSAIFIASKLNELEFKKTISRLKIMSNSIKYYSKKISSFYFEQAIINLLDTFGAKYDNILTSFKFSKIENDSFEIDYDFIIKIIGTKFSKKEINDLLKQFGIICKSGIAIPPSLRIDIKNNHDLAEEILKLNSLNDIKHEPILLTTINLNAVDGYLKWETISNSFINSGFYQIKNYNLISKEKVETFNWFKYDNLIKISNPISSERQFLRPALISSLIDCYSYNSAHKNTLLPIFEIQDIYVENKKEKHLSFMFPSSLYNNILTKNKLESDIFICKDMLSKIENIFNFKLEYRKHKITKYTCDNDSLDIYFKNKAVGFIGRMCPNFIKEFKISDSKIYMGEINFSFLSTLVREPIIFTEFEKIHPIIKELTLVIDSKSEISALLNLIKKAPNMGPYEVVDFFEKNLEHAVSIKFEIINIEKEKTKLALREIIAYFRTNNIKIPDSL